MFLKENTPESTKKSKKSKKMEKPEKCPLCCENMEPDDLNFLPCPCGYKVCLFCWNRIKTSESDPKCPLCRRTYSENPAKFEPLSAEQLQKLKNKKKQEDVKKKQKLAEDRKQLADLRVVRKNLIFVNELPLNFNKDPKSYQRFLNIFKQAGQVKKTTILNSSKNYAGQKAPYARAYVTYQKNEEALKALKLLENTEFEGRELKLSLGTTKYCSNYIKNVNCTNKECVYLHEQADAEASFTKEQIHAGKHIEYGQKLYEQYIQYINNLHTKSISNQTPEEKKPDPQPQHTEEPEKEIITENSIPASTSQLSNHQNEKSSPTESDNVKAFKQEFIKAANLADASLGGDSSHDLCDVLPHLSPEQCAALKKLISLNTPQINSSNNSTDISTVNKGAKMDISEPSFEERFAVKKDSLIPNGNPFHEERYSTSIKESLLSRLNIPNSHKELSMPSADSYRSPFSKEIGSLRHINSDVQDSLNLKLESKDDCGLDFDPVQMALGGLGELVVSEKQKARVEVNSLNVTPVNAFKKQSNQQPRVQQPVYSPNNFLPSTSYQNRSQNSPVIDYYNQAPYRPPSVQSPASVSRSSVHSQSMTPSQRSQIAPFANALTIQLPRFSPGISVGNNSMVNGYSPQQYISQVSPQDAFMLSQQQSQNFENFSQSQFSNFDQVTPPQVFSVNSLQNQSVRENPIREFFGGGNIPLGQRLRSDIGRQQQFQQQQQQSYQQLQRINSYCNSTPQGESLSRPKGNNTFP